MSMVPGYYGAQAPVQQMTQGQQNVMTAVSMIPNMLQFMVSQGMCTYQEAQALQNALNFPQQMASFQQHILSAFGEMVVAPQQIQQTVLNKLQYALNSLRMNMNRAPAPTVGGGFIQQGYQQVVPTPQQLPQSTLNMMATYGEGQQAVNDAMSAQQAPAQCPPKVSSNNPTGTVTPPQRTPTNQVYNIEVPQDDIPVPEWFEVPMPQDKITMLSSNVVFRNVRPYKLYKLIAPPSIELGLTCWRVAEPQLDEAGAYFEVEHAKKAETEWAKEMDMISYDEVKLIETPYLAAVEAFKEAKKKYTSDKTARGAIEVCKFLGSKGQFGAIMLNILLTYFNQAASVNFIRYNPMTGGVDRMGKIENEMELSRLMTDNNDETFASWKEDTEAFSQALKMCLFSSFNRVFSSVTDGYIDMSKKPNKDFLLIKFYNEMNITGGLTTVMAKDMTPDQEKDIQNKLSRYFALKIERKLLIHDLDIADVGAEDFKLFLVNQGLGKGIMTNVFRHFGSIDLIDRKDKSQLQHPLRLGSLYGGSLIVRRMLS